MAFICTFAAQFAAEAAFAPPSLFDDTVSIFTNDGRRIAKIHLDQNQPEPLLPMLSPNFDGATLLHGDGAALSTDDVGVPGSNIIVVPPTQTFMLPAVTVGQRQRLTHLTDRPDGVELETISLSPRILRARNFLSNEECEELRRLGGPLLQDSALFVSTDSTGSTSSQRRTSSTSWLGPNFGVACVGATCVAEGENAVVRSVLDRAGLLVRRPPATAEGLQVVRYKPGEQYAYHTDYFTREQRASGQIPMLGSGGDRFATLLLFLNDADSGLDEGGETNFAFAGAGPHPSVEEVRSSGSDGLADCSKGLSVTPKRGDALLFYNLLPSRSNVAHRTLGDNSTYHAGCAIIAGEKWVANLWFWSHPPDPWPPA